MKMTEEYCDNLLTEIWDNDVSEKLNGWGEVEFDSWYIEPAGFRVLLSGDWKHMHERADQLVKEAVSKYGLFVKIYEEEVGHSNCDWYRAYHKYMFRKSEPKKTKAEIAYNEELKRIMAAILND